MWAVFSGYLINLVARLQGQDYTFLSFMYRLVNYALFVGAELATYIRGLYIPLYLQDGLSHDHKQ